MIPAVGVRRRTVTTTEWRCKCERCGHRWTAMAQAPPVACAACKARRWNVAPRWRRADIARRKKPRKPRRR